MSNARISEIRPIERRIGPDISVIRTRLPIQKRAENSSRYSYAKRSEQLPLWIEKQIVVEDLRLYYQMAEEIVDLIGEVYSHDGFRMVVTFGIPQFSHEQIDANGAMGLKMRDGIPYALWTPLGDLFFVVHESHSPKANKELKLSELGERLGLRKLVFESGPNIWGQVCSITISPNLDPLPEIQFRLENQRITPEHAMEIWKMVRP